MQGKCWEWGVPADTRGRKDLLWGWDKAKLHKEEALKCPSPTQQHPGRHIWHLAHLHTSTTVSLSSALLTTKGRGAEKWSDPCHC